MNDVHKDSLKNWLIQAKKLGSYWGFPLKLLVACAGMAGCLGLLASGRFSFPLKNLRTGCIIPPAMGLFMGSIRHG
jgi:hypothetical protein